MRRAPGATVYTATSAAAPRGRSAPRLGDRRGWPRGAKVRAEVATAGAHGSDEVRFHRVGRGRRGRHEVEIVEAREERARRVIVVVVARWDDTAGAVEREERPHLGGDAPGGGDRDPAPAVGSAPQGRHLDDERLARVDTRGRCESWEETRGRDGGQRGELGIGRSLDTPPPRLRMGRRSRLMYRARDGPRTWRNRREPRARRSRTSPRRTSPAVAARPSRWTSRAARSRARL